MKFHIAAFSWQLKRFNQTELTVPLFSDVQFDFQLRVSKF